MHKAVGCGDFLVEIDDDGKVDFDAGDFFEVEDPGDVGLERIDGDADGLDVEAVPISLAAGELDELGGADGGEVGGVREEHDPLALGGVVREADDAVGGFCFEVGGELEDAGDAGFGHDWFS